MLYPGTVMRSSIPAFPITLDRVCKNHENMPQCARVAELADALDLGSSGIPVGVRVPSLAPSKTRETTLEWAS